MKCDKCGCEGTRADFKYIGPVEAGVVDSIRVCPQCKGMVYCDELAEDERCPAEHVWGMKALGKKIARKEKEI